MARRTYPLRIFVVASVAVVWLGLPSSAAAQRAYVGPAKCTDCHDHKDEKEWSEKRDGDGKGKQHINAVNQLSEPNAAKYAAAIGLADAYDVKGTCVKCHATVVRGSADFGISCESCHGPGKDYLTPHQEKGAYEKSIPLGMKDVWKKPDAWVRDCLVCHVLGENASDSKLAAANHPIGDNFMVGTKFVPVAGHWTSKYTANQINAIGEPIRKKLLSALRPTTAAAAPAAAPEPAAPAAAPAAPAAAPAAPAAAAAPAGAPAAPSGPAPSAPVTPAAPSAPRAPRNVAAAPPGLPTTPPPVAATPVGGGDQAITLQLPPDPQLPPTPTGIVASIQGRLATLLDTLLSRGATTPTRVTPPTRKTVYRGADADLLRLQDEVIALALEALSTAPAQKTPPPNK